MQALLKRYRIILPSEHGSWSLTLVPFVMGAGVAAVTGPAAPRSSLAVLLCLLAVMALFLARQPATLWLRIRRGRGPRAEFPAVRFWALGLTAMAALAGIGLLALGRWPMAWLALPALAILALTLVLTTERGPRQLTTELIGVVGLALSAPAAYVSVVAELNATAWLVWAVSAVHSLISVLYVRLRIDERHRRASQVERVSVVVAHLASLLAISAAALVGWLPWAVTLATAALLVRALIVAWRRPSLDNVRRFGFVEIGVALAFSLLVILGFMLARS